MSNQAHKARLRTTGFPLSSSNEERYLRNKIESYDRRAKGEARRMELDPRSNPSGKAKYVGTGKMNVASRKDVSTVTPSPDPAASSRGANVRANKERGTQSSTQRKVIK
jgi:hypothetical protein